MAAKIIVLGIGNILLSDDGVGVRLLENLRFQYPCLPDVTYLDGGVLGLNLAVWLQDVNGLIVLDAAELGTAPGTVQIIMEKEMDTLGIKLGRSAHDLRILDLLTISQFTGIMPQHRALVAIQYQNIDWGLELSDAVQQALPQATLKIYELILQWSKVLGDKKC